MRLASTHPLFGLWSWRRAPLWRTLALSLALGNMLPAKAAERVLALGGDVTETVCALGACEQLVGVDSTSLWPESVRALPNVGYVRRLTAEGVLSLRPRLILATHDAGPPQTLDQLKASRVRVEVLEEARDAADIVGKLRRIGALLDRSAQAEALARTLDKQAAELAAAVDAMPTHPRVLFVMSAVSGGLVAAGRDTAADAAIRLAGGVNVVDGYSGYKPLVAESLIGMAPQALVMMREQADRVDGLDGLREQPGVAATPAARDGHLFFVEGQALLGFGPRTLEQAIALQRLLAGIGAP